MHQKQEETIDKVGIEPYQRRYRWVMLALVWLLYCSFGLVSGSIASLITPILEDLKTHPIPLFVVFRMN